MTIMENNNTSSAPQQPVSNVAEGQQQQQKQRRTFGSIGGFEPFSANIGSESVIELKKQLTEILKDSEVEFTILDMDRSVYTHLYYSALIIAERPKANPGMLAYQILVMAGTNDAPKSIIENVNMRQLEVTRLPSDVFNDRFRDTAKQIVQKAFPNSKSLLVSACVVPADFNVKDPAMVRRLAHNAGTATNTELIYRSDKFVPVNLGDMDNTNGLVIDLKFNNQQIIGADCEPIRSSVIADFSFRQNQRGGDRDLNNGTSNQTISQLSGFVDALYVPVPGAGVNNPWAMMQQGAMRPTQKFMPRFIITDINSRVLTPEMVLLALATGVTLRDDNNWVQTFKPTSGGKSVNLTDIGALNIDANITNAPGFGEPIDTTQQTFTLGELGQLVAAMFRPELVISMDVPDAGPQTWYTDVFVMASRGNNSAYNVIYNAANELTGGRFERHFANGQQMFVDIGNRVHLGHWTDRNGEKRDIRDFDHIAVCNRIGKLNPALIAEWSDTWVNTQKPILERLQQRKQHLVNLSGETAVFTGWAERVTFSLAFIQALSQAIRETGLPVNVTTPLASSDFNNQRGVASWANEAGLGGGQTFTPAFIPGSNIGYNMNVNGGRW